MEKQILEEVVKLYISFQSFINGDCKERKLFGNIQFCSSCLFLAYGGVLSVLAVLGLW